MMKKIKVIASCMGSCLAFSCLGVSMESFSKIDLDKVPVLHTNKSFNDILKTSKNQGEYSNRYLSVFLENREIMMVSEKGGQKFPLCFAIFDEMAKSTKKGKTLEIAGADGCLSLSLMIHGAQEIHICDLDQEQYGIFKKDYAIILKSLPQFKDRVEFDCSDYFKIHQKYKKESYSTVICQNLLHFLEEKEQDALFESAFQKLEKGGQFFVSCNFFAEKNLLILSQKSPEEMNMNEVKSFKQTSITFSQYLQGKTYQHTKMIAAPSLSLSSAPFSNSDYQRVKCTEYKVENNKVEWLVKANVNVVSKDEHKDIVTHYKRMGKQKPEHGIYFKVSVSRPIINEKRMIELCEKHHFDISYFYYMDETFSLTDSSHAHFFGICAVKNRSSVHANRSFSDSFFQHLHCQKMIFNDMCIPNFMLNFL